MYPDLPILGGAPWRSLTPGATYDPRSFVQRYPPLKDPYDPRIDAFEGHLGILHENVHWLHHQGTTFGALLTWIQASQEFTTLRFLREAGSGDIASRLARGDGGGPPLLSIDLEQQRPLYDRRDSENMNLFRQIWFDHQWVYQFLDDASISESAGAPTPQQFGEVLGDVILVLSELFGTEEAEDLMSPLEMRSGFTPQVERLGVVRAGGSPLTSRSLLECSATIAELRSLDADFWRGLNGDAHEEHVRRKVSALLRTSYGVPLRAAAMVLGAAPEHPERILSTVSALCYLALNPPVPPYSFRPPPGVRSWGWEELYPPARFGRLVAAVARIGLLPDDASHHQLASYLDTVCDAAGLPLHSDLGLPEAFQDGYQYNWENEPTDLRCNHFDFLRWAQVRLHCLRTEGLPVLVNPGECTRGPLACDYVDCLAGDDWRGITTCPIVWTSDDRLGFTVSSKFGHWFLRNAAVHRCLFDTVVGTGDFNLASYPPEVESDTGFMIVLKRNVQNLLFKIPHE